MSPGAASEDLTQALIAHELWYESGVPGVFGRSAEFERIVTAFENLVVAISREHGAEERYFPPVVNRDVLIRSDYLASFPDLCGSIHSFCGDEQAHGHFLDDVRQGKSWDAHLEGTGLALTPAACYPLYPTMAGRLPPGGRLFNLSSYIFRREPSTDPARLQVFRMRENVRLGGPEDVESWRSEWLQRGLELLGSLGLPVTEEVATDPFFGRGGKLLKANQRASRAKFEITVPISSAGKPTAIASFNYHEDKFGTTFGIFTDSGEAAHTACLGFGLERVALALLKTHGFDTGSWPAEVRARLDW